MELSLSLNNLKFANVMDFTRSFGIKKTSSQNGGSLTTKEFNESIALPFDIQRPVTITENTTVNTIEYDAKLFINTAGVTLSLTTATEGIKVTIISLQTFGLTINNTTKSYTAGTYELLRINNSWINLSQNYFDLIHPIGSKYTQLPDDQSPNDLWGNFSHWIVKDYGGVFLRTEGESNNITFNAWCSVLQIVPASDNKEILIPNFPAEGLAGEMLLTSKGEILEIESVGIIEHTTYGSLDWVTLKTAITKLPSSGEDFSVLLIHKDTFQEHEHRIADGFTITGIQYGQDNEKEWHEVNINWNAWNTKAVVSGRYADETAPKSMTVRIWERDS